MAEIHDDLSENMRFQKLHFYNTTQIDTTMRNNGLDWAVDISLTHRVPKSMNELKHAEKQLRIARF